MTVTYTGEVATCRGFGTFLKLLARWRGSIYKLVWLDLLIFLSLYYILNLTYRLVLNEEQKRLFEGVVLYCGHHGNVIPLSFVLGFYVTVVMTRWWNQYITIPWPDPIAVVVSANIHGQDERGRLMRRTIMRYVCLSLTMVLRMLSPRVKKRFPELDNLVEAGLLLDNEKKIMEDLNLKFPKHAKHWMPIVWAASIVTRARKEGRIRDDFAVKTIIDELNKFRGSCGRLIAYDTISVPLVYTQVVTLAVYSYFLTSAVSSQWTELKDPDVPAAISNIDLYFPIFATLEFFFYMGWLKVAESLINPFGEDDDDFEVNWIVDRDLQVSYMIVDEMHHEHPQLIKDQYWDEVFPSELPYTIATENQREEHPEPSTARIGVPARQRSMVTVNPSNVRIDHMVPQDQSVSYKFPPPEQLMNNDDAISGIHFNVTTRGGSKKAKKDERNSLGSSNSIQSMNQAGHPALSRVASVTSVLKRLFSKEDGKGSATPANQIDGQSRFTISASNASLGGKVGGAGAGAGGSMKIATDVIEEVDEHQTTVTSVRNHEPRPTAMSVFAGSAPAPSAPVDVPRPARTDKQVRVTANLLSASAPARCARAPFYSEQTHDEQDVRVGDGVNGRTRLDSDGGRLDSDGAGVQGRGRLDSDGGRLDSDGDGTDGRGRLDSDVGAPLSAAASQTMDHDADGESLTLEEDEFDRLKHEREQQRKEKYLQILLARSVSAQQGGGDSYPDNELLLRELALHSARRTDELRSADHEDAT